MSYSEAVIIPYAMFRKCHFQSDESKKPQEKILEDSSLPIDVKLKLYNQSQRLQTKEREEGIRTTNNNGNSAKTLREDTSYIVDTLPEKYQPYVRSILEKIKENSNEIGWNEDLEIRINGKPYPNSNIIHLLKFIMKNLIVTNETDKPIGASDFVQKLKDIGVPRSWIRVSFTRQSSRKSKKRKRGDAVSERQEETMQGYDEDIDPDDDEDEEAIPPRKQTGQGLRWLTY